jgi:ribosomal protein L32E
MARVRGAPYHPNDKGKISVPVRRRVEKKIASVKIGYRTGVLILTREPDRPLPF